MPELGAAELTAGIIILALNAYAVMGGADFGGGVWDLFATGPRRARQRELIAEAIGPIWEANHVWLILAIVLLFTCFPPAFARLGVALHIPLTLMLIGIVLRGSAFTFRSYDVKHDEVQRRWSRIFAYASLITPVLLGVCVGAVASGRLGPLRPGMTFADAYLSPWLRPFPLGVGLLALTLFAFLAAVYLTIEATDQPLREDFRRRALVMGICVFLAAALTLGLAALDAPLVRYGLMQSPWALGLHLLTGASAVTALGALWLRRWQLARAAAIVQVSLILWGWALAQYPFIIPPDIRLDTAAAPPITLRLVLIALAVGAVVLLPSLYYLFRVFKSRPSSQ